MHEAALEHFGFGEIPFGNDSRGETFESKDFSDTERAIRTTVERHSKILVTAPIGAGKTEATEVALQRIRAAWDREHDSPCLVVPMIARDKRELSVSQVEETLHDALGLTCVNRREIRARKLHAALEARLEDGGRVVLFIDEAHDLRPRVMRELKTLHELRSSTGKPLFALVLVGQDTVKSIMRIHAMHLWQRIRVHELRGLRRDEIGAYIGVKLEEAGKFGAISPEAIAAIKKAQATWFPLDLNQLCQQALEDAWRKGEKAVSAATADFCLRPSSILSIAKAKGISQNRLADIAGVASSTASTFFAGGLQPDHRERVRTKMMAALEKLEREDPVARQTTSPRHPENLVPGPKAASAA